MRTATLFLALLTATLLLIPHHRNLRGEEGEDALSRELIATYFDSQSMKMSHTSVTDLKALSWYIVSRARRSGAWRLLLERAGGGCGKSIHLLGMMLAREAHERLAVAELERYYETGPHEVPFAARDPRLNSDIRDEVVPVLLVQLRDPECNPYLKKHLLLALVRSGQPGLKDDYLRVLVTPGERRAAQFYAAAGLLRMGEDAGAEWMRKHGRGRGSLESRPSGAKTNSISDACEVLLDRPEARFVEDLLWF